MASTFPLPQLEQSTFRLPSSPLGWAVLASIIVHGVALGWIPGVQRMQSLVAQPLKVLLQTPVAETTAVPPAPTLRTPERVANFKPTVSAPLPRSLPSILPPTPVIAARDPHTDAPAMPINSPAILTPAASDEPAPRTAASSPPPAAAPRPLAVDPAALAAYGRHLSGAVAIHQRYPRVAQLRQWQGTTLLQIEVTAEGQLLSARVLSSSGHEILDSQAIDMVRAASPLPPPPSVVAGRALTVDVPVVFRLAS